MRRTTVAVLGTSGMLGSMVFRQLSASPRLRVLGVQRGDPTGPERVSLDAESADLDEVVRLCERVEYVVNAIGVIKPYITDTDPVSVERAIRVNAVFPHVLAKAAERTGTMVLQIATDCVYAGTVGAYDERAPHDPYDVYGKTKSLGEVRSPRMRHLRGSIIGPETHGHVSLLDWFRFQPRGARLRGFTDHRWNGVTTLHFAKICQAIVESGMELPALQHVVPGDVVTKHELLCRFREAFGRTDIEIEAVSAPVIVDRTLTTTTAEQNQDVWRAAGYLEPPTVWAMIDELARAMAGNSNR